MSKKLKRYEIDGKICGVCEGLGRYYGVDPTFLRIAFIIAAFYTSIPAIFIYIILTLAIPNNDF